VLDDGTSNDGTLIPELLPYYWESLMVWEAYGNQVGVLVIWVEKILYPNMSDQGEGEAKDKDETMEVQFQWAKEIHGDT
jgi:hypothetical protein